MNATASPQLTQAQLTQAARQALTLMDLTSLNDSDTDSVIEALCQQVKTPFGNPAAVCVYPQFIVTAARALGSSAGDGVGVGDPVTSGLVSATGRCPHFHS